MNLITRKILHPNFLLYYKDYPKDEPKKKVNRVKIVDRKNIFNNIDRAKAYLIQEKKFKKGDKVVLGTTAWPEYLVWFFAVAELGGSFVVSDTPAIYNSKVIDYRLSLYDKIDHFIFSWKHPSFSSLFDIYIYERSYINYKPIKEISELINCEPTTDLLYSTSSGTTSIPKVVSHNHDFFFHLTRRNSTVFGLKEKDRCLHSKNLHHGSVLGVYFLPTIKYCKHHYWQIISNNEDWIYDFENFITKYKVNRCLIYHNYDLEKISETIKKFPSGLSIKFNLLAGVSNETIDNLVGRFKHEIISIFGCTETSGPTFLLNLDYDNYQTKKYNNFGKPLDDFYKIYLDKDQILNVEMPDGKVICTGDQMEIIDGEYHHLRRVTGMKINQVPIYLDLLINVLNNLEIPNSTIKLKHGIDYDLCIDSEKYKIYMRSNVNLNIEYINSYVEKNLETTSYNIAYILVDKREKYLGGIKLDAEKLRRDCRLRLGISI